jgi:hypothetical protein
MTTSETITLKLDRVDAELVRRAKHAALDRGLSLRAFVLEALERSVSGEEEDGERTKARAKGGARR